MVATLDKLVLIMWTKLLLGVIAVYLVVENLVNITSNNIHTRFVNFIDTLLRIDLEKKCFLKNHFSFKNFDKNIYVFGNFFKCFYIQV